MKIKKIPQRMCNGCMEMKNKKDLVRVVKSKEGEVSIDLTGKKPGRGAYICKSKECFTKAYKTKRLEKNLDTKIDDTLYEKLKQEVTDEK